MSSPINRIVGKVVERLDVREQSGARLPKLSDRQATTLWYLRNVKLLRIFPAERIRKLVSDTSLRQLAKRENWLVPEHEQHIYILADGGIKLSRLSALGRRLVEGILSPGDMFGSLSGANRRVYQVEALSSATLLRMRREALATLLRAEPALALEVVQMLEARERRLSNRLEGLVFKDVPTRVVEVLIQLSHDHGEPCQHGFAVDVRVSQQDIADLVGASRQMVNRVIRDLTIKLYVKRKGRVLCILNMARLERLAESLDASPRE